jgi:hypothetical protein
MNISCFQHGLMVTTPYGSRAEGFWNDSGVSSHTKRSVHAQKRLIGSRLLYRMARLVNMVAFLPMTLRHGTQRNTIRFETCNRTEESIPQARTPVECFFPPVGGAAFIPMAEARSLSPRYGKIPRKGACDIKSFKSLCQCFLETASQAASCNARGYSNQLDLI